MKIPGSNKNYNALLPPPSSTRGAVASAQGTPDYYKQKKKRI